MTTELPRTSTTVKLHGGKSASTLVLMKTEAEIIQENCKRFRAESGFSQQQIAERIGQSIDSVRAWEQGRRTPDRDSMLKLARLWGRSMEDFFSEDPPPPRLTERPPWEVIFKLKGEPPEGLLAELEAVRDKYASKAKVSIREIVPGISVRGAIPGDAAKDLAAVTSEDDLRTKEKRKKTPADERAPREGEERADHPSRHKTPHD